MSKNTTKEIWCEAGKRMVFLPDGAFDQSLIAPSFKIPVCVGCEHKGHAATMKHVTSNIEAAQLVGVTQEPNLTHSVQVVTYLENEHVQCSCNCYAKTVK